MWAGSAVPVRAESRPGLLAPGECPVSAVSSNQRRKRLFDAMFFDDVEVRMRIMPMTAKKTKVRAQIDRMVKRIVKKFDPEKIILFGSQARGDAGPDSDVDLLVVMPVEGPLVDKRLEIRGALHDIPVPIDVIVTTPEDFAWRKKYVGTIERPAAREGKVLYARS